MYYLQSRYYDPEVCRFINADNADNLAANGDFASYNLYAYCGNNPVARKDDGGAFWNIVIGAAVGGIVSGVIAGISSYKENGHVDWGKVAINAAVGAIGGAVAATGLGALAQAGITAAVCGVGNFAEQAYTKGVENVNYGEVLSSTLLGGATSLVGTGAGNLFFKEVKASGNALVSTGRDKMLTGYVRQSVGQSHSATIRQGAKYLAQGKKALNTFYGLSSSNGSIIGGGISIVYNWAKKSIR